MFFRNSTGEQIRRMERLVKIQVAWAEEFVEKYPVFGSRRRRLYTKQDTPQDTSVETYMRGELATYSDERYSCMSSLWKTVCWKEEI